MIPMTRMLDFCLSESVLQTTDEKLLLKSRILVGVSLMYFLSMLSVMLILLLLAALNVLVAWPPIISCACSSTCYFFQIIYFKKTGNQVVAAIITMSILLFFTSLFTYLTGGWHSPLILFLFVVPMYAFLITGYRIGIVFTAAIIAVYAILGGLQYSNIETPHVIAARYEDLLGYFSWLFSWSMIVGGVTLYSTMVNNLNYSINAEKEKIRLKVTIDEESGIYTRKVFNQLLNTKTNQLYSPGKFFALVFMELTPRNKSSSINTKEILGIFLNAIKSQLKDQVILSRYSSLSITTLVTDQENHQSTRDMLNNLYHHLEKIMDQHGMTVNLGAVISSGNHANINTITSDARNALLQAKGKHEKIVIYSRGERTNHENNYSSLIKSESFVNIIKRNL